MLFLMLEACMILVMTGMIITRKDLRRFLETDLIQSLAVPDLFIRYSFV